MYFIYVACQVVVLLTLVTHRPFSWSIDGSIGYFLTLIFDRIRIKSLNQSQVDVALGAFFPSAGLVMSMKLISKLFEN